MTRFTRALGIAATCTTATGVALGAPVVSFNNQVYNDSGAGFGNVLTLLALHAQGTEAGSIQRSAGLDMRTGDATNQSRTVSVGDLAAANVNTTTLGLVFNISQPPGGGSSVTLRAFSLIFYNANDTVLFTADFVAAQPLVLDQVGAGVGTAGWLFNITFSAPDAALFFGATGNRIGMVLPDGTPILNSAGGPDTFYLIPTPGALSLGGVPLLLALRRSRRN